MADQDLSKNPVSPPTPVPEAWARTEAARNPQRPYPMDFIEALFTDFSEIHGDRAFGDDTAMTCGMARIDGQPVLVIGNLKGRTLKERVARKFGSPDPEGYRKALRAMKIAEKFGRPIFTFIDLAGANPGIGAEERGQGEAIARNLLEMSRPPRTFHSDHHGRGRLRRRPCSGRCGSRAHVRKRDLLGHLA